MMERFQRKKAVRASVALAAGAMLILFGMASAATALDNDPAPLRPTQRVVMGELFSQSG